LSTASSSLICTGTGNSLVLKVRKREEPEDRQADLTWKVKLTTELGGDRALPSMPEAIAS
jgi:hypothetical protein